MDAAEYRAAEVRRAVLGLARSAVERYVKERRVILAPTELIPELSRRAGTFVCIKKFGTLRGCIGTIEPARSNVALEIIFNAISSAMQDPRFPPVTGAELEFLTYSVDVLGPSEPVASVEELDPRRYGVIVECGARRGLLLPDLEGVDSAAEQVAIAARKAGIDLDSSRELLRLCRFEVIRYEQSAPQ